MKRTSILLCILFAITANFIAPAAKAQVNTNDSLALVDLYNSTNGPNWQNQDNWLTTMPVSTWYGVEVRNNRVNLLGEGFNGLSGSIPSSIGNLDSLDILNLQYNQLSGAIPSAIGNLSKLTYLGLDNNQLSGAIPSTIGNLTNLTELDLEINQLSSTIPSSIGNLTALTYLNLGANQLTGTIPSSVGNLSNVDEITFDGNKLSGTIPSSIGNLTNLTGLDLSANQLTGTIPSSVGNLSNVDFIALAENQLSGTIPASIGNLSKLSELFLNNNQLSGSIPSSLGKLSKLAFFYASNNYLSGTVPASFNKLKGLYVIDLSYNRLSKFGDVSSSANTHHYHLSSKINNNLFTFDGLQYIAKRYPYTIYTPQDTILSIHQNGNTLSVSAGGTLSNNTYNWFKVGAVDSATINRDSTFSPPQSGMYYVNVTNNIVKGLDLHSDTINYTMPLAQTRNSIANVAALKTATNHFSIYPNPASNSIHIQTTGTATIILTNSAGKILLTKTINNSDVIIVSAFANGTYYIQNKTSGETQKVVVIH